MRLLCLTAVLILAGPAPAADPKSKARAEAAAALALAASCDCPAGDAKCGRVSEVLAKVSKDIADEGKRPAVAPMPREKKAGPACDCDGGECVGLCPGCKCKPAPAPAAPIAAVPAALPAALEFTDANGCRWVGSPGADGRVTYTRVSCPPRR